MYYTRIFIIIKKFKRSFSAILFQRIFLILFKNFSNVFSLILFFMNLYLILHVFFFQMNFLAFLIVIFIISPKFRGIPCLDRREGHKSQ